MKDVALASIPLWLQHTHTSNLSMSPTLLDENAYGLKG